jgi:hypothetical protein
MALCHQGDIDPPFEALVLMGSPGVWKHPWVALTRSCEPTLTKISITT